MDMLHVICAILTCVLFFGICAIELRDIPNVIREKIYATKSVTVDWTKISAYVDKTD